MEYSVYNNVEALILSKIESNQVEVTNYPTGIYLIKVETTYG